MLLTGASFVPSMTVIVTVSVTVLTPSSTVTWKTSSLSPVGVGAEKLGVCRVASSSVAVGPES